MSAHPSPKPKPNTFESNPNPNPTSTLTPTPTPHQEEEEDEAAGAQLAAVGLGGALLRQASALLAPPAVDASGNPAAANEP